MLINMNVDKERGQRVSWFFQYLLFCIVIVTVLFMLDEVPDMAIL